MPNDGREVKTGRPRAWLLERGNDGIFIEAVELRGRGRLTLPPPVRHGIAWLAPGKEVLGSLEEHGKVRLLDLESADVVTERMQALKETSDDPNAPRRLAVQHRYRLVTSEADGRLHLPLAAVAHLDAILPPSVIYAARMLERVELWSQRTADAFLESATEDRDLP